LPRAGLSTKITRAMTATRRRFALALSVLLLPATTNAAEQGRLPPERTFSSAPYLHRIPLRDETTNPIPAPKAPAAGAKADDAGPPAKAFVLDTTCGKCHSDIDVMKSGWHFNFADPAAPAGRAGEPWILTDVHTRTQLPLSYRPWTSVTGAKPFHPHDVGINDFNFALNFARHLPGGGIFATSQDLRFKMSGKLEIDCLICHTTDNQHDQVLRANEIGTNQNFKWAPIAASFVARIQGNAQRLKDTWDPNDPDAPPGPKVIYDPSRFDAQGNVTFNVAGPVPNDRCLFCHTTIDVGHSHADPPSPPHAVTSPSSPESPIAHRMSLESRWRHDRDIHLAKGMLCVECHKNGADHMTVRGYEGEAELRKDPSIATLTCAGCHGMGGESSNHPQPNTLGGRLAAPRPLHKGLPTLHFDLLTCTACHSGPWPDQNTIGAQTSMAHKLGLPRHHHADDSAPNIQEPVFLRDTKTNKITPYRMIYPAFWARQNGEKITPIQPADVLAAGTAQSFGQKPNPQYYEPFTPLTKDQIVQVLTKLDTYKPPAARLKQNIPLAATTQAATAATQATPPYFTGTPVYITGGKAYKLSADKKSLADFDHDAAKPYAWPIAHDVRGAQQALGARGCTDCHAKSAPIFDGKVHADTLLTGAVTTSTMNELRNEHGAPALALFALTYPMRPILITIGYACTILLALIVLNYAMRATGLRRRV
jgi:hypothetical protein